MKVRWTPLAVADLENVFDHIAENNSAAAAGVIGRVEKTVEMLSRHPELGRQGRVSGTREAVVVGTPFVIAYRLQGDALSILSVIHAACRWPETL